MPAARTLRLARTRRWASVASGTRNARAISGVCRPPTRRRVSATRASRARAGWQQVKISRSRSSAIELWSTSCSSVSASAAASPSIRASASSCSWRASERRALRSRSIAAFLAAVVIQAAGLSGTPLVGQLATARANASWTASSAMSRSRTARATTATAAAASSRKTRAISASVPLTAPRAAAPRSTRTSRWGSARRSRRPRRSSRTRPGSSRRAPPWSRRTGRR